MTKKPKFKVGDKVFVTTNSEWGRKAMTVVSLSEDGASCTSPIYGAAVGWFANEHLVPYTKKREAELKILRDNDAMVRALKKKLFGDKAY